MKTSARDFALVMVPQGSGHYNHAQAFPGPNSMKRLLLKLRDLALPACVWMAMIAPAVAQQVTVERDSELRAEPRLDAKVVATLKPGAAGEVTAKNGAWLNIRTAEATGWLFSFNVRFASAQQAAGSGAGNAAGVGRLFGPRQNVNVTSTIGIRGLEADDLRQARFDAEQMRLLEQYSASRADAESRAQSSGLSAAQVDYFDAGSP